MVKLLDLFFRGNWEVVTVTLQFPFLNTSASCFASKSRAHQQNEARLSIFPPFQVRSSICSHPICRACDRNYGDLGSKTQASPSLLYLADGL